MNVIWVNNCPFCTDLNLELYSFQKKPCYQNIFIHILTRYTSELEYWMGEIYIQAGLSSKLSSPLQQAEWPEYGKYIWLQQGKV